MGYSPAVLGALELLRADPSATPGNATVAAAAGSDALPAGTCGDAAGRVRRRQQSDRIRLRIPRPPSIQPCLRPSFKRRTGPSGSTGGTMPEMSCMLRKPSNSMMSPHGAATPNSGMMGNPISAGTTSAGRSIPIDGCSSRQEAAAAAPISSIGSERPRSASMPAHGPGSRRPATALGPPGSRARPVRSRIWMAVGGRWQNSARHRVPQSPNPNPFIGSPWIPRERPSRPLPVSSLHHDETI